MGSAILSLDEKYRYVLTRQISQPIRWVKPCLFIMLNPSTADAEQDDPTIRRCMGFARSWGATSLTVCNLFGFRATDPKALSMTPDPVGPENDIHLFDQIQRHLTTGYVIAAWGAHPIATDRATMLRSLGFELSCLGKTKDGSPRHPLYVKADQKREPL